jgi:peptidoglycan-binding protein CsiV
MPGMNLRALAAFTGVALVIVLPAASQETSRTENVYNIEIVVFRANQALGGAENWNVQASRNYGTGDETGNTSRNVGRFVRALPATSFQLTDIENKLRASGLYVPVAHVAWSQTASDWGTRAGFTVQKIGINAEGLNGTVFLERGMYLHLGVALSYAPPNPPAGLAAGPGTTFQMSESRRIRFYERNYYDHPGFGVIALVTPAQGARPAGR